MTWIRGAAHRQRPLGAACLAVSAVALSGCLVSDGTCSANQTYDEEAHLCSCAEGAVPDARGYGCIKCGEHEQVVSGKCECASGYARPAEGMPCEELTGGVAGAACSADMPCAEPYPYCATANGESFCTTQGCTANEDCPVGWLCDTPGASGFCREPFGLGKSCASPADCAGGEATFCESFMTMSCIIEKCASNPSMCPSGNVCCDATAFLGTSLCTPTAVLMNGLCFDGQAPVSP